MEKTYAKFYSFKDGSMVGWFICPHCGVRIEIPNDCAIHRGCKGKGTYHVASVANIDCGCGQRVKDEFLIIADSPLIALTRRLNDE